MEERDFGIEDIKEIIFVGVLLEREIDSTNEDEYYHRRMLHKDRRTSVHFKLYSSFLK